MKKSKATEFDHLLHAELNAFEKEENNKNQFSGVTSQYDLTESLKVIKASVEEVFGPLFFSDPDTKQENVRTTTLTILLGVIQQVCPRQTQPVYNVVEQHCCCENE